MTNLTQEAALQKISDFASRFKIDLYGQVDRGGLCTRGGSAVVYQGTLRPNGILIALKVPCGLPLADECIEDVLREVHTWSKLRHKNVLELLGITTEFDFTVSIVSRWMERGNAHAYVQDKTVDPRPLLQGISQGLQHLHGRKEGAIFHGDLKGFNVLISAEGIPLLTDFGFSHLVNSSFGPPAPESVRGTYQWMAPEKFENCSATAEGDVWAFGMTALELFTRKVPFHECMGNLAVMNRIVNGPLPQKPVLGDTYSRMTMEWWKLCCRCWEKKPQSRPKTATIVQQVSTIIIASQNEELPVVPDTHPELSPTVDNILEACPRFRILVIGKSGVGKSSLIQLAFGITEEVTTNRRGKADINKELISQKNTKFILHDSEGLEPGERQKYSAITSFIQHRKQPHLELKEQLHAVWICFQIPLMRSGERLIDTGMEDFLSKKSEILGNVPTIFVFTKYDKIIDQLEEEDVQDVETAAEQYLEKNCVQPIKRITKEDIPFIAVTKRKGHEARHRKMIELTSTAVSKCFAQQLDGPSPVAVVTVMAQRVTPSLKVDILIAVGKRGYWKALAAAPNFSGYTIWDCLRVIHADVVSVWNFYDPAQYLTCNEFRELMVNMIRDIGEDSNTLLRMPSVPVASSSRQRGPMSIALVPIKMPFTAGLAFARWVYNTYQRMPVVQRMFMTYIIDLTNVLKALFCLVFAHPAMGLKRRSIKLAYNTYFKLQLRKDVHAIVKAFDPGVVAGRDAILERVESLVRLDNGLSFSSLSVSDLEHDEEWHTVEDGK